MTPATTSRPGPAQTTAADRVTYGAVHLDVTDLTASLRFWVGGVGLTVLGQDEDGARLGVEDRELVVLHPGAKGPVRRGRAGLYHLAIHLPSEAEFARSLGRLSAARIRQAPTDHVMHWATYAWDPDGIGLELSFETLDRFDAWVTTTGGDPGVRHADGRVTSGRDPLDLDEVFSYLPDQDFGPPMPAGTRIGHVHLHVADIDAAVGFYSGLGFELNHVMDGFGMADLRAGGAFPHRLAVNVWQGEGAPPKPEGSAGLRHVELHADGEPRTLRDPSGNALVLTPR